MKERPFLATEREAAGLPSGAISLLVRVVEKQPTRDPDFVDVDHNDPPQWWAWQGKWGEAFASERLEDCPFGTPGDRLLVKEQWGYSGCVSTWRGGKEVCEANVRYHADKAQRSVAFGSFKAMHKATPRQNIKHPEGWDDLDCDEQQIIHSDLLREWWASKQKISAAHMPRWASRTLLDLTDVRVIRVREITEEDAKAAGAEQQDDGGDGPPSYVAGFMDRWPKVIWDANYYVWLGTVKRAEWDDVLPTGGNDG